MRSWWLYNIEDDNEIRILIHNFRLKWWKYFEDYVVSGFFFLFFSYTFQWVTFSSTLSEISFLVATTFGRHDLREYFKWLNNVEFLGWYHIEQNNIHFFDKNEFVLSRNRRRNIILAGFLGQSGDLYGLYSENLLYNK